MRLISWNVNGLRANVKKGGFDWFLNESPDIYCIQETKARKDQLEEGVISPSGYYSFFDHAKTRGGYSGVAVYSRFKPDKVVYGLDKEQYDQEGRLLGLFFNDLESIGLKDANGVKKLAVFNVYFPNGGGGPDRLKFKLEYYAEFLRYMKNLMDDGYEIIFTGDINTAHTAIDLARPKENEDNTGFLPIEREWIDQVIDNGFVDVFRSMHPKDSGKYTYWDMKTFARDRNVGWRIDYFFVTKKLYEVVKSTHILDHVLGSDHCPIDLVIG